MIELYGTPRSRSLRVSWLLEELSLDWQYRFIDFGQGAQHDADFRILSPEGKIPVLIDNGEAMFESLAICIYLAEKYGLDHWLPARGTHQSALHWQWCSFIVSELEQGLWTLAKHKFALPEPQRCPDITNTAHWEFQKAAKTASIMLAEQAFCCGDQITVADILLAHTLGWAIKSNCELPENLQRYYHRMASRPTMRRALQKEIDSAASHKG